MTPPVEHNLGDGGHIGLGEVVIEMITVPKNAR
jgi:hypothetical protein